MKKVLSTLVAALVAVSFAGMVFAADAPYTAPADTTPAAGETKSETAKPMKKHKKHKKTKKAKKAKKTMKKEEAPAAPAAPAEAPAAK